MNITQNYGGMYPESEYSKWGAGAKWDPKNLEIKLCEKFNGVFFKGISKVDSEKSNFLKMDYKMCIIFLNR